MRGPASGLPANANNSGGGSREWRILMTPELLDKIANRMIEQA
jgi:hypothetical protein